MIDRETIQLTALLTAVVALLAGAFFYIVEQNEACVSRGGVLARGAFGFVCVAGPEV